MAGVGFVCTFQGEAMIKKGEIKDNLFQINSTEIIGRNLSIGEKAIGIATGGKGSERDKKR